MCCSPSRRLSGPLAAGVPGLPAGSARARRHRPLAAAPHGAPATAAAGRRLLRLRSSARWSVCTVEATTRRARRKRWGPDSVLVPLGRQSRMSPARSNQESVVSAVESPGRALAGDRGRAVCGPWSRSGHAVSWEAGRAPVQPSVSAATSEAGGVPAIGCIVGTHAAERSSPALRVA